MKLFLKISVILIISSLFMQCTTDKQKYTYAFKENGQGIELLENGQSVFFYQRAAKSLDGKLSRDNYIHPLYSLTDDTLTEDFPKDHPHQRGIFWAWHQILSDSVHISDSWALINFSSEVTEAATTVNNDTAIISLHTLYKSPIYNNSAPYLDERTTIKTFRYSSDARIIQFKIALKPLIPNLSIGGSDNEKGYGGFSARIKMPDSLKFLSQNGYVTPQKLQINAGSWLDFSAPFGSSSQISGITLLCDPRNPNYPQPWIIRQKSSMQNVVWPGSKAVEIPQDKPLILRYSLIIHNNSGDIKTINKAAADLKK